MPRFYCPVALHTEQHLTLPPTAARHVQVLRLQPGDTITVFNGQGGQWQAEVLHMGRSTVQVRVGAHTPLECEAPRPVHLAVGMPANERMDWLVEKATELGVASIQPLAAARSVLKLSGERAQKRQAHWQAIAQGACEQCGRNRIPDIAPPLPLTSWLATLPAQNETPTQRLLLSLRPQTQPLHALLPRDHDAKGRDAPALPPVWVLHGPEGGLTEQEEDAALAQGFAPISLGPRVLRAETAALAALTLLTSG